MCYYIKGSNENPDFFLLDVLSIVQLVKIFSAKKIKNQLCITIYISYNATTGDTLSKKTERKVKIELTPQNSCSKS